MAWTSYFDEIFLINLPTRPDRLKISSGQLKFYDIPYSVVAGIGNIDGRKGIYNTLLKLFRECVYRKLSRVLIFEDDFKFLHSPNEIMQSCIDQLPLTWRQLYLGANLPNPNLVSRYSENLLLTKRALALHAVAYSLEMMEMILSLPIQAPIDLQITNFCHDKEIYCTYPLLATQTPGISNVEKKYIDWGPFIEGRYDNVVNHLKITA